jgi:hypothetical protein
MTTREGNGSVRIEFEDLAHSVAETFLSEIARRMVLTGEVDPTVTSPSDVHGLAMERLREHFEGGAGFTFTIDHRSSTLEHARSFFLEGRDEYSLVFHGLYIEHTLNLAIRDRAIQLGLAENEAVDLMRRSLHDKTGLTWKLLFDESFPQQLRTDIETVANRRNAFAHYKWQNDPTTKLLPAEVAARRTTAFDAAERAAVELDAYRTRLFGVNGVDLDDWFHERQESQS